MLHESMRPTNRVEKPFQDELRIYRARIVSKPDPGDDRLQVRIMPHMADIENTEALPKFPPFFKGQVIVGKTEQEEKKKADFVWVAALPDFTMGFIMGLANNYETANNKYSNSYNYKGLIQGLVQRGVANNIKYQDLYVQFWNDTYMEFVNKRTGEKYIVQSTGTMFALTQNQVYIRVGNEDNRCSILRMDRDNITLTTKKFQVNAEDIALGQTGLYVAAISGTTAVSTQGTTFHPQTNIRV